MLKIEFTSDDIDGQMGDFITEAMHVGIPFTIFPEGACGWPEIGFKTDELTPKLNGFLVSWFGSDYDEFLETVKD